MRTLRSFLPLVGLTLCALPMVACGDSDSVIFVEDIEPIDINGLVTSTVDAWPVLCFTAPSGGMGNGECEAEPFSEGFARITLVNNHPPNPLSPTDPRYNPLFGRRRVDAFRIIYQTLDGGPEIASINGRLNVVLGPGERVQFPLVLLGSAAQDSIGPSLANTARLYSVRYTFGGPDVLDVEGAVTVSIGDFTYCPDGTASTGSPQICSEPNPAN